MEKITFTTQINYSILNDAIRLRTSLSDVIEKVEYSFNSYKYEQQELVDNLGIHCNRALLSSERDEIVNLVNSINDDYDLVIRDKIKKTISNQKIEFGKDFLSVFAASNTYLNKSAEQISNLLGQYPNLIMCCLTGSIETLLALVHTITPDDNISQSELDEFIKRIEIFLASLDG
jgi:hypothetical protein